MTYCGDEGLPTEFRAFEHMNRNKKYGKGQAMITEFESPSPSGNLEVPLSGYYTFYIAGEGSVYINEQLIVQSSNSIQGGNGIQGREENIRAGYGVIALSQGLHQLELKESNADTQLHWSGPGLKRTKLEPEEKHNYLTK